MSHRVILYHKQATSARTRFLKFSYGSVCAFEGLPKLAQLTDSNQLNKLLHPASILDQLVQQLGFAASQLQVEGEYLQLVDVPGETIQIMLVAITSIDPPFEWADQLDAQFIDITMARDLPQIELELLRHAYELLLG